MIIKTLAVGPLMANCFIVGCETSREGIVIDPGGEAQRILDEVSALELTITQILNTHGHFDHVGANRGVHAATGARLLIHALDAPMLSQLKSSAAAWGLAAEDSPPADGTLSEGDRVVFGTHTLAVLHTPGHTTGGISLVADEQVFVGDTLFAGSIGRSDFPGGDHDTLVASIRTKLFKLPDSMVVYTGHGPETTIGHEKRTNPFVGLG